MTDVPFFLELVRRDLGNPRPADVNEYCSRLPAMGQLLRRERVKVVDEGGPWINSCSVYKVSDVVVLKARKASRIVDILKIRRRRALKGLLDLMERNFRGDVEKARMVILRGAWMVNTVERVIGTQESMGVISCSYRFEDA